MFPPKVSVIIPAFNSADTICEALDSVAAQTFRDFEVIVVDDGSSDDTAGVAEGWGARNQCSVISDRCPERFGLQVIRLERNAGPAAARNRGIAEAKGIWIAFLDADDAWLPWRLECQIAMGQRHSDAVLFCGGVVTFGTGTAGVAPQDNSKCRERPADMSAPRLITLEQLAVYNPIATSTVLVRKYAVDDAGGFDEQFRGPEDYDLWLRIASRHPVLEMAMPLSCYRERPGSLSMNDRAFLPQVLRVLDKAYGPAGVLRNCSLKRRARGYQYHNCAWMAYSRGDRWTAIRHLLRSWWLCPHRVAKEMDNPYLRLGLLYRCGSGHSKTPTTGHLKNTHP